MNTTTQPATGICYVVERDGIKCDGVTGVPGTAKGLCSKHYNRLRRYGDVHFVKPNRGPGQGPGHPLWKGDDASYTALHNRVYRARGKASHCEQCGAAGRKYEWAMRYGTDGTDVSDYVSLCKPCHRLYDLGRLTLGQREEIARRVAAGESQTSLAREFGIHPSVISRGLDPDAPKWQTQIEAA
jgi:hypothetical protein